MPEREDLQRQKPAFKKKTVGQTLYLPSAAHDVLRKVAFDERVKMHDVILEGLSRAFLARGLPPISELTGKT